MTGVYLDIYSVEDLASFTRLFATEVVSAMDTPLRKAGKGILNFFKSCRPTATPTQDGIRWSFELEKSESEATLKDTFEYLRASGRECVIAIDEFQQVREFPEGGVEALVRGYVQNLDNVHFIFAGSRRHLMQEMFALPRGPFYKSTQLMELGLIDRDAYRKFAKGLFRKCGRGFREAVFDSLYDRFGGITWYIQAVLNRTWEYADGMSRIEDVDEAVDALVAESDFTYGDLMRSQTTTEQLLLRAVAAENRVKEISGRDFVDRYSLPSPSTIRSAVADLVSRDLLYRDADGYIVYDRIFDLWLKRLI